MPDPVTGLFQLVYVSTALTQKRSDLAELVREAAARNRRLELSGLLLSGNGQFVQLIEGRREQIVRVYRKIRNDPRHTEIHIVHWGQATAPLVAEYAMALEILSADQMAQVCTLCRELENTRGLGESQHLLAEIAQPHCSRMVG